MERVNKHICLLVYSGIRELLLRYSDMLVFSLSSDFKNFKTWQKIDFLVLASLPPTLFSHFSLSSSSFWSSKAMENEFVWIYLFLIYDGGVLDLYQNQMFALITQSKITLDYLLYLFINTCWESKLQSCFDCQQVCCAFLKYWSWPFIVVVWMSFCLSMLYGFFFNTTLWQRCYAPAK